MTIFVGFGLFLVLAGWVFRIIEQRRTVYTPFQDKVYREYHPAIHARRRFGK